MIEKFTKEEIESAWAEPVAGNIQSIYGKINELVDAVNGILDYAPLEMAIKAEPKTRSENVQPDAESRSENVLTKSLRMDKEFAEDECVRLQNELERTRKALDVAVDALKEINDRYESEEQRGREEDDSPDWWDFAMDTGEILTKALEQITALEQKDK